MSSMDNEAGFTAEWGGLGMFAAGNFHHLNILKNIDL
jgi:hypothetical protein